MFHYYQDKTAHTSMNGPVFEQAGIFFQFPPMLSCMFPRDLEHFIFLQLKKKYNSE